MNCLEFRRRLTTEPARREEDALRHQRECVACAAFARRQAAFERRLAEAVRLEVPEGLVSRLLLHRSLSDARRQRAQRRRWLAVAAGFFLAIGLANGLWLATTPPLVRTVLTHIYSEPDHLREHQDVQLTELNQRLLGLGVKFRHSIGRVNYAGSCWIRKQSGAHLVLQGNKGPVTVLLMPGESVDRPLPLQDRHYQGVILPRVNGSLAIVGEHGEEIDRVEARLRAALHVTF